MIGDEIDITNGITRAIVRFKDTDIQGNANALYEVNAIEERKIDLINASIINIPVENVDALRKLPNVLYVEYDQKVYITDCPDEEPFPSSAWGVQRIRAPEIHAIGDATGDTKYYGAGIKVCVIDTGIDYTHPDLAPNYKGGYNLFTNTNDPLDDHGHGTAASGIIGARGVNEFGIIGIAPHVDLYAFKMMNENGSGSIISLINAIEWCINNDIDIISMSLGSKNYSIATADLLNIAYNDYGILMIASAGNNIGSFNEDIVYPAKYNTVIAVTATDFIDRFQMCSDFWGSNSGSKAEIAAPGSFVYTTSPTYGTEYPLNFYVFSGTSASCPHVSGAAALIWAIKPDLTNVQVRNILCQGTIDLGNPGRDIYYGYGLIDAVKAVSYIPISISISSKYDIIVEQRLDNKYDLLVNSNVNSVYDIMLGEKLESDYNIEQIVTTKHNNDSLWSLSYLLGET